MRARALQFSPFSGIGKQLHSTQIRSLAEMQISLDLALKCNGPQVFGPARSGTLNAEGGHPSLGHNMHKTL